jgi:glycerol dehydrogenase
MAGAESSALKILGAPQRYIQGPGAIGELGAIAAGLGRRPFVVADAIVTSTVGPAIRSGFEAAGLNPVFGAFSGEITRPEIDRMTEACRQAGADLVIGAGGGKAIDTAKGVKLALDLPMIVLPTIASNDSPTSRVIVIYDEHHRIADIPRLKSNPEVVLVDTTIIAQAPVRFLRAGIGDALSKKFEVEQNYRAGGSNFYNGRATATAVHLAGLCYDMLRGHAEAACAAVGRREVTEDLERTVEASILLSGLGFESGGLAAAHALTRGLTAVPETSHALHGEMVAFGLLVQLVLEGRDQAFLDDLLGFYRRVGLSADLGALGLADPTPAQIRLMAVKSWDEGPNYVRTMLERGPMTTERFAEAIARADALGRAA